MNALSRTVGYASLHDERMLLMARWLKTNGGVRPRAADVRQLLLERYPEGLLSPAEMEALLGTFTH